MLSPHITFVVQEKKPTGLIAAVGRTRAFQPAEIGTAIQAQEVARTVQSLASDIAADDVKLVLIKCPLLTSEKIEVIKADGRKPVTNDTYESMARSRYVSALGIAVALGELPEGHLEEATGSEQEKRWSSKASCSSGAELEDCQVLILAEDREALAAESNRLQATSGIMKDAMDAPAIIKMMDEVKRQGGQVIQAFVKAEADPRGHVRGYRHTMSTDSDIHSTRHARAAVGGLVAGLLGDPMVYVSGGAEGQGPDGGGSISLVYRVPG